MIKTSINTKTEKPWQAGSSVSTANSGCSVISSNSIGNFKPENPFFLAPLAGVTDAPTRLLYGEMGAGLVYSEMVSAKGMHYGDKKTKVLLDILPGEAPVAFQIFGSDPEIMAEAAHSLESHKNVLIDVNMGCPVPKVFKNGDGSALLKSPEKCHDIIRKMKKASSKPITAKIRLGISESSINCVEVAKALEEGGADAVCVHGRTREAYYSGKADYEWIAKVKDAVKIPVIGNGDVVDINSCKRMFDETGVDFIMIGRGAMGNPWIFRELNAWLKGNKIPVSPSRRDIKAMMMRHAESLILYKGERVAVNELKKHLAWYTKGQYGSNEFRRRINTISDAEKLYEAIDEW